MMKYVSFALLVALNTGVCCAQASHQSRKYLSVGEQFLKENKMDSAFKYLDAGYKTSIKSNDKKLQAGYCRQLGSYYCNIKDFNHANWYLNNALGFYIELKSKIDEDEARDYMKANHLISFDRQKCGGIEIGSKGVKYSILSFEFVEGKVTRVINKDGAINTQIIDFTDSAINASINAVNNCFDTLVNNKIEPNRIFIAVSSGVHQEAVTKWKELAEVKLDSFQNRIIEKVHGMTGQDIRVLTTCEEVRLTMKGVMSMADRNSSSLIDIGSGNTKGGTFINSKFDNANSCIDIPFGSVTVSKMIAGKEANTAIAIFNEKVLPIINQQFATKKGLTNSRKMFYYTGGAYWALCNYLYPGNIKDEMTKITRKDIYTYYDLAINSYDKLINPDLSNLSGTALDLAKEEIKNCRKVFNDRDKILAGAMIMKAIVDRVDPKGDSNIKMKFIRFGYIGWLAGLITEKVEP